MALHASLEVGEMNLVYPLTLRRNTPVLLWPTLMLMSLLRLTQDSYFLFGVASVGSVTHAMEMCIGCPFCPT